MHITFIFTVLLLSEKVSLNVMLFFPSLVYSMASVDLRVLFFAAKTGKFPCHRLGKAGELYIFITLFGSL